MIMAVVWKRSADMDDALAVALDGGTTRGVLVTNSELVERSLSASQMRGSCSSRAMPARAVGQAVRTFGHDRIAGRMSTGVSQRRNGRL
jgi:hypothetical protein